VVNFTNILQRGFEPIFFFQKNTKQNCDERKGAQNTLLHKIAREMLVQLITPNW